MLKLESREPDRVPLLSDGRLSVAQWHWQLEPPQDALIVLAKATFDIVPGAAVRLAAEQAPPSGDLAFEPDLPGSTLRYASDFEPHKPLADLLIVGHAYPPRSASVARVAWRFGRHGGEIVALGDREWTPSGPSEPRGFERMPLRYERAFGGPSQARNPVGMGLPESGTGLRVPNLELPQALLASRRDRPGPACFAPIPRVWRARSDQLGTYDDTWLATRWPYFPKDAGWGHCNAAPPEQQLPYPRGDEDFDLSGFHPELATVSGKLAGLRARAFAQLDRAHGWKLQELTLVLDTVWFDLDALKVVLVWRGHVDVSHEHAPELDALFVCLDDDASPASPKQIRERLFLALAATRAPGDEDPAVSQRLPVIRRSLTSDADAALPTQPALSREQAQTLLGTGLALDGLDLSNADLSGLNLARKKLRRAILTGACLDGACLDGADLSGATLLSASAVGTSFKKARLSRANLFRARLERASFEGAELGQANLDQTQADEASFAEAQATGATFGKAELSDTVFDRANLSAADFGEATLNRASLRAAQLKDASLRGAVAQKACFDEALLEDLRADDANFADCSFRGARSERAVYLRASLPRADFSAAKLAGAVLNYADLAAVNLSQASAPGAQFQGANLGSAKLLKADLMQSSFINASLRDADLRGANLFQVDTWKADTRGADLRMALTAGSKLAASDGGERR